jgi:YesN/AraC family two-component response regulator
MPKIDGLELYTKLREKDPNLIVIPQEKLI